MNSHDEKEEYDEAEEALLREMIVASDGVSIPVFSMDPPRLFAKLLRRSQSPIFAVESRRIIRVESEQVPKRILKHFKGLQTPMQTLGFHHNFFATLPTIGPLAIGMMSMTTPNGKCSFLAVQTVVRKEGKLIDSGFFSFQSYLDAGEVLMTLPQARVSDPRADIKRVHIKMTEPEPILREHRKRMREYDIAPIDSGDIVEWVRHHNWMDVNHGVEQERLRPATSGEISKIRIKTKRDR